ncbi:phosphoglycerate mutase family protein [Alteromonas sp. ASW11-130]|uniref:phosphoglycerate mutase family protein n=1 Tax=Alteromonas sp. ASW11-130 TaxID=3015775 RepID=UPI0022420323|nr:phosphoglycerate mutase family protein [Alteromonas sp. ASW11-130]MCW8090994.1 histidine phosphatase family protein [Alteromonas sp. ASW11-130]
MFKFFRSVLILALFMGTGASAMAYDVYLTRHYEKQSQHRDPELTAKGQWRAKQLIKFLEEAGIQKIYSTQYRRTQQSVAPLAERLDIEVETYPANGLAQLAEQIKHERVNALVVGHSNTTPAIISLLGGKAKAMSEDDFGELFKLRIENEHVETSSEVVGLNE